MGREIKRVPLDFDWPLNKVWDGFINDMWVDCPFCKGTGSTTACQRLGDLVSLIMLSGSDSLEDKNHPYFVNNYALHHNVKPSPDMAELTSGLAGREPSFIGHDACDKWSATNKIIKAAGLDPKVWGVCTHCDGEGCSSEAIDAYTAWEESPPPEGDGWQIWETVSEGSPISPVFDSHESVVEWLVNEGYSRKSAENFTETGWVPSGIMSGGVFTKDIESARFINEGG